MCNGRAKFEILLKELKHHCEQQQQQQQQQQQHELCSATTLNTSVRNYSSKVFIWVVTPLALDRSGFRSFLGLVKLAFDNERGKLVLTLLTTKYPDLKSPNLP